jgi:hypothetical protein
MSTTAKRGQWGDIRWTGHFWKGFQGPRDAKGNLYLMTYEIVGAQDSKHYRDTVDGIEVTNGTCNGKGWDVVLFGEVVAHEDHKTDAQRAAADLAL